MDADDPALEREDARIDALEDRGEEQAESRGEAAEQAFEDEIERLRDDLDAREDDYVSAAFSDVLTGDFLTGGLSGAELHVLLGLSVLLLGLLRVLWRSSTPLPPWAPHLGPRERRLEAGLEKALLTLLFVVPGSGLLLLAGSTDLLPVHVATQLALLAVVAVHVGLVLKHTVVLPPPPVPHALTGDPGSPPPLCPPGIRSRGRRGPPRRAAPVGPPR